MSVNIQTHFKQFASASNELNPFVNRPAPAPQVHIAIKVAMLVPFFGAVLAYQTLKRDNFKTSKKNDDQQNLEILKSVQKIDVLRTSSLVLALAAAVTIVATGVLPVLGVIIAGILTVGIGLSIAGIAKRASMISLQEAELANRSL